MDTNNISINIILFLLFIIIHQLSNNNILSNIILLLLILINYQNKYLSVLIMFLFFSININISYIKENFEINKKDKIKKKLKKKEVEKKEKNEKEKNEKEEIEEEKEKNMKNDEENKDFIKHKLKEDFITQLLGDGLIQKKNDKEGFEVKIPKYKIDTDIDKKINQLDKAIELFKQKIS